MRELRVPILVNKYERAVDSDLARLCAGRGLRLLCKPRVAVNFPVNDGSIDRNDVRYALMAHFDFVIADPDGYAALAVEFDGPRHVTDPLQVTRDERKDRICRTYALPIVRVGASAFHQADDRRTFLQWLLQVWAADRDLREAWDEVYEAEENGEDPGDLPDMEPKQFSYRTYGGPRDPDEPGRMIAAPLDVFRHARRRLAAARVGVNLSSPDGWYRESERCTIAHVGLPLGDGRWLLGAGRVSLRGLYPWVDGLCPPIVAQDMALLDLARQLDEWESGQRLAMTEDGLERAVKGCEHALLAVIELPSTAQRMQFVLRTIKSWGVDTDDPQVFWRVYSSFMKADDDFAPDDDED